MEKEIQDALAKQPFEKATGLDKVTTDQMSDALYQALIAQGVQISSQSIMESNPPIHQDVEITGKSSLAYLANNGASFSGSSDYLTPVKGK